MTSQTAYKELYPETQTKQTQTVSPVALIVAISLVLSPLCSWEFVKVVLASLACRN
jgi:hypothetical protein